MANQYVDVNTLKYFLYQVHQMEDLLEKERFQDHDKEALNLYLDSVKNLPTKSCTPTLKKWMKTLHITKMEKSMSMSRSKP